MMDEFTVMPLQIYNWASLPQAKFHHVAATGIIVLLAILLTFNALAVFIRQTFQKSLQ
jgi:phosphate transport system permease protein